MKHIDLLTDCTSCNIKKYTKLSDDQLKHEYELPCGCEKVTLENLASIYQCGECEGLYYYSFCLEEVVEEDNTWHCKSCGTCRESSEWHCKKCNDCTYGLTLRCDGCGKKSPYTS